MKHFVIQGGKLTRKKGHMVVEYPSYIKKYFYPYNLENSPDFLNGHDVEGYNIKEGYLSVFQLYDENLAENERPRYDYFLLDDDVSGISIGDITVDFLEEEHFPNLVELPEYHSEIFEEFGNNTHIQVFSDEFIDKHFR